MKIVVIHGNPRRQNTYEAVHRCLKHMKGADVQEFFLPTDFDTFCAGCINCILKGSETCPHAGRLQPILSAILDADGLILSSPVYVMSLTGSMKNFLDHLACYYITHRPLDEMFSKKALVVSTSAGAGPANSIRPIRKNLKFLGVNRIYSFGCKMFAIDWESIPLKRQRRIERKAERIARKFYADVSSKKTHRPYLMQKFFFYVTRSLVRGYEDSSLDKIHWREKGMMDRNWFVQ